MISTEQIWTTEGSHLHFLSYEDVTFWSTAAPPSGVLFCGHVDARRMLDTQGVFEEFSRVLQFPVYFGWNWDAFSDCLRDMAWKPAQRYLIVIENAESLLSTESEDIPVFLRILKTAADSWGSAIGLSEERGEAPVPFNVVLLHSRTAAVSVRKIFDIRSAP